jgi:hypothetical protein
MIDAAIAKKILKRQAKQKVDPQIIGRIMYAIRQMETGVDIKYTKDKADFVKEQQKYLKIMGYDCQYCENANGEILLMIGL